MAHRQRDETPANARVLAKKLDAVGWGLVFIWIGMAVLADLGWTAALVGVGVIAVGTQLARKHFGLPVETFGLLIGIIFVVWGLWELLSIQLGTARMAGSLLPILSIVVGILIVATAVLRTSRG